MTSLRDGATPANAIDVVTYQRTMYRGYSEARFQAVIVNEAHSQGWLVAWQPDAFKSMAVRTGQFHKVRQGDSGFPDLVLVHAERGVVVYAEIKSDTGTLRPEQKVWRDALIAAGQTWRCWRPRDWPEIRAVLHGEET